MTEGQRKPLKLLLLATSGLTVPGMNGAHAASPGAVASTAANWTGWYAGLNLGITQHSASENDVNGWGAGGLPPASYVTPFFSSRDTHAGVGGQLGYNWQANNWVFGGEADLDWVGAKTTFQPASMLISCGPCAVSATNELNWMATFRARAGYAFGNLLVFGTAGLALGGIDDHWGWGFTTGGPGGFNDSQFKFDGVRAGFIYGGGVEYAVTDHWRVRGDIMYVNFGTVSDTISGTPAFGFPGSFTTNFHNSATLGHLALSYRW